MKILNLAENFTVFGHYLATSLKHVVKISNGFRYQMANGGLFGQGSKVHPDDQLEKSIINLKM